LLGLAMIWVCNCVTSGWIADALLSAHMVEHLLLMSFAPPLLFWVIRWFPMLRGSAGVRIYIFGPLIRIKTLRNLGYFLVDHWLRGCDESGFSWLACARGLRFRA